MGAMGQRSSPKGTLEASAVNGLDERLRPKGRRVADVLTTNGVTQTIVSHPISAAFAVAAIAWLIWKGPRKSGGRAEGDLESGSIAAGRDGQESGTPAGDMWNMAGQTSDRCEPLRNRFSALVQEQPLALGSAALALGMVIGFSLPATDLEDEWMGPSRDRLFERIREALREMASNAWNMAGQAQESRQAGEDGGRRFE